MNASAESQQTALETDSGAFGDGAPLWMSKLGVGKSKWLNISKGQLQTMQEPGKPLKVQVWATGMLHDPGYKGEEAFRMRSAKKVPLTSKEISDELCSVAKQYYEAAVIHPTDEQFATLIVEKEEIRRALSELEVDGVAERTDAKGTPLRELSREQSRRVRGCGAAVVVAQERAEATSPSRSELLKVGSAISPAPPQLTSNQVDGRLRQFARDLKDPPSPSVAYSTTHPAAPCCSLPAREPKRIGADIKKRFFL